MDIDASVLADAISDEFEGVNVSVDGEDCVVLFDSFAAGMWMPEDFEAFEERVEVFVMEYTASWRVENASSNRIEGYHRAVLRRQ